MVTICLLVIKNPKIEITTTTVTCVTIDEVLSVLTNGNPVNPLARVENIFLNLVPSNKFPRFKKPIPKDISKPQPILARYLLGGAKISKYLLKHIVFP